LQKKTCDKFTGFPRVRGIPVLSFFIHLQYITTNRKTNMDNFDQEQEKENSVQPDENNMSRQSECEQEGTASVGAEPPQENAEESCGETTKKGDRRAKIFLFASLYLVLLICIAFMGYTLKENNRALEEAAQENKSALVKAVDEVAKENKEGLSRALEIEYEIKSNSQLGKEAMELSRQALEAGNGDLAKVYVLNAINHVSSDFSYLESYYNLISQDSLSTQEDYSQFLSLVDLEIYQIAAEDIEKALAMRDDIAQKMETIVSEEAAKSVAAYEAELADNLARLSTGDLSWKKIQKGDHCDMDLLAARMELEQGMLGDGVRTETQQLPADLEKASLIYQLEQILQGADAALKKAEDIVKTGTVDQAILVVAQNQLQTAASYLTQVWTTDCDEIPAYVKRAEETQKKIGQVGDDVTRLSSKPSYDKIVAIVKAIDDIKGRAKMIREDGPNKDYTLLIEDLDKKLEEIVKLESEIRNESNLKEIAEKKKYVAEIYKEIGRMRFDTYNEWAKSSISYCWDHEYSGAHWDEHYAEIFKKYLVKIHPGLLNPEVRSLYDLVSEKFIEQSDRKGMKLRILKAQTRWTTLEDF
jgi:hypothetical protein